VSQTGDLWLLGAKVTCPNCRKATPLVASLAHERQKPFNQAIDRLIPYAKNARTQFRAASRAHAPTETTVPPLPLTSRAFRERASGRAAPRYSDGFLAPDERVSYGRPVGVTIGPDGSLLVADDVGNVIWRVTDKRKR
jgi:hypothetical protein